MSYRVNATESNPLNNEDKACKEIKNFYRSLNYSERENFEANLHNYCIRLIHNSINTDHTHSKQEGHHALRYHYTKDQEASSETYGDKLELNLTAIPEGAIIKAKKLDEPDQNKLKVLKGICTLIIESRKDTLIYKISNFFYNVIGIHLSYSIAFLQQTIEDCETILNPQHKNGEPTEKQIKFSTGTKELRIILKI